MSCLRRSASNTDVFSVRVYIRIYIRIYICLSHFSAHALFYMWVHVRMCEIIKAKDAGRGEKIMAGGMKLTSTAGSILYMTGRETHTHTHTHTHTEVHLSRLMCLNVNHWQHSFGKHACSLSTIKENGAYFLNLVPLHTLFFQAS